MDSSIQSLLACVRANNAEISSLTERYKKDVANLEATNKTLLDAVKADILAGKKVFGTPMENLLFLWTNDIELPGKWFMSWFEGQLKKTAGDFLLISNSWQENCLHGGPDSDAKFLVPKTSFQLVLLKDDPISFDFANQSFCLNCVLGGEIDERGVFQPIETVSFNSTDFMGIIFAEPIVEPIEGLVLCKESALPEGGINKKFSWGSEGVLTVENSMAHNGVLKDFLKNMNLRIDWDACKIISTESLPLSL